MYMKEMLSRAKNVDREIAALEEAQKQALANVVYQSPSFAEAVQGSHGNSSENKSIAYSSYVSQLDLMKTKLLCTKNEVLRIISGLEVSEDRMILVEYFINGKKVADIANDMNFDESTVRKRINKSIAQLEKIYR